MSARVWKASWFSEDPKIEWPKLENALGAKLAAENRVKLADAMADYLEHASGTVRANEVRPELAATVKSLASACSSLSNIAKSGAAFGAMQEAAAKRGKRAGRAELRDLLHEMHEWRMYAHLALDTFPEDRGGPTGDPHIGKLLTIAHSVFSRATGVEECTGSTLAFLKEICGTVGYHVHSDAALRKAFERAVTKLPE